MDNEPFYHLIHRPIQYILMYNWIIYNLNHIFLLFETINI